MTRIWNIFKLILNSTLVIYYQAVANNIIEDELEDVPDSCTVKKMFQEKKEEIAFKSTSCLSEKFLVGFNQQSGHP